MRSSCIVAFGLFAGLCLAAQAPPPSPLGSWEGESFCTIPDSPCHNEHVIYDIAHNQDTGKYEVKADRVVNGEREYMGTLMCDWSAKESLLVCTYRGRDQDAWDFHLAADTMTGTLVIKPDKLYRKISVKRRK